MDASQGVIESYKYDTFGNLETPPATGNPYTYTGREYDSETSLYFYRARYYDAETGRFLSADPIRFRGGVNFYSYVRNNPVILIDPYGFDYSPNPIKTYYLYNGATAIIYSPGTIVDPSEMECIWEDQCTKKKEKTVGPCIISAPFQMGGNIYGTTYLSMGYCACPNPNGGYYEASYKRYHEISGEPTGIGGTEEPFISEPNTPRPRVGPNTPAFP